jgi:hypothetical protein
MMSPDVLRVKTAEELLQIKETSNITAGMKAATVNPPPPVNNLELTLVRQYSYSRVNGMMVYQRH